MKRKRSMLKSALLSLLPVLLCQQISIGQAVVKDTIPLQHGAHRIGKRTDSAMARWRGYGLGQFIHWGLYAIPGGQWNGKEYNGAAEWIRSWNGIPNSTYDSLIYQFNPTKFDAAGWARTAKQMGARYVTITTKHHDGFCLWPSKFTNYTVASSPYKKDIIGPLVDAYNKEGIDVILYFSVMDWHHPGWRYSIKTPEDSIAFEGFKQFTRNQLLELLHLYPSVKGLWFDGTWDASWVKQAAFADDLEKEMRALVPGLIIGSRFRPDDLGKRHTDSNGRLIGDYEQGWERKLPKQIEDVHGNDWDCVMTIPPNQWGYKANWSNQYIKTPYDLTGMLMQAVSLGGNLVINFGPKGDGSIRKEEQDIAKALGSWLAVNKEAVYNVEYAGLPKPDYGYFTRKGNLLYLTVFNRSVNNIIRVPVPKNYGLHPQSARLLLNKQNLPLVTSDPGMDKDANLYYDITLPKTLVTDVPFVIEMTLEKNTGTSKKREDAKT
ncbi:MAG: alpha-L-fucosidase [Chitinophagaceae bacterium]